MRTNTFMLMFALLVAPGAVASPPGFAIWSGLDLATSRDTLRQQLDNHLAIERLGDFGSHYGLIAFRDADGEAEYHESVTDFYVVIEGHATLIVGGEIVGSRETAPGEFRGTSIREGVAHDLGPGDMVNIPPRTAHQVLVEADATFTYFILKVYE